MIVADLIRYDDASELQAERDFLLELLGDVLTDLDFAYSEIEEPTDEQKESYKAEVEKICGVTKKYMEILNPTEGVCATLRTKVAAIKAEAEALFNEE